MPTGNGLDLVVSHTSEIPGTRPLLRVEVNGLFVSAIALDTADAAYQSFHLDLPVGLLQAGSNSIAVDLETDAICAEETDVVKVTIHDESTLDFGYEAGAYEVDLSLYPFPFTEASLVKIPTTIVLPDRPTAADLTTAATIAAGLGRGSRGTIDVWATSALDFNPEVHGHHHLIIVGHLGSNSLFEKLTLPLATKSARIEPRQGVLEEIISPWNGFRLALIVSGLDNEGLLKAAQALDREARFLPARSSVAAFTELRPVPGEPYVPPPLRMTLASLGYEDEIPFGARPQDLTFGFSLPLGWQPKDSALFALRFAHASILDPHDSIIDVRLNGIIVGSTFLDDSNANEGALDVPLPGHLLKPGSNRLEVRVDMNLPPAVRDRCRNLRNTEAWTMIRSESEIALSPRIFDHLAGLHTFPYPFSQASGLDRTVFILPEQPGKTALNHLVQLAARLGSPVRTDDTTVYAAYSSDVSPDSWMGYHLILLGLPSENLLLAEFGSHLPYPLDAKGLAPLVIDGITFELVPSRALGLLEMTDSPWDRDRALIAITGTSDEGTQLAVQALLEHTRDLQGNLAVAKPVYYSSSTESGQIQTYSTNTRGSTPSKTAVDDTTRKSDLTVLAKRWWR